MRFRNSYYSIALAWAMLPLTVFAGLPRMACICANGQHKFFCERHRMTANDEDCVCCYGRVRENRAVARMRSCCTSQRVAQNAGPTACKSGRPCQSVVEQPAIIAAAKVVLDLDRADHEPFLLAAVPMLVCDSHLTLGAARGDVPPHPDRVATLGVLLI